MNAATLTATAARFHFTLPAGLLAVLQRAVAAPAAPAAPVAPAPHGLEAGATLWVAKPFGQTVTCESGTLWLTFDHEPLDVVLEAGQSHRCDKASTLAIHALAPARLRVA
jgi:hypothetical protein